MDIFPEFLKNLSVPSSTWIDGKLLIGKKLAGLIYAKLSSLTVEKKIRPGLCTILVGNNIASQIYVKNKIKVARELGYHSVLIELPEDISEVNLLEKINDINNDDSIHGILVQLPLPKHISSEKVIQSIVASKDVDGFHYENIGRIWSKSYSIIPCTPYGIAYMLYNIPLDFTGKHAVVVGRSDIVGKPIASLLLNYFNCTVTMVHSYTENISDYFENAFIIVIATGVRNAIKEDWIPSKSIVFDVGIHRTPEGKIVGDMNYRNLVNRVSYVTPVPNGVGPLTIGMLMVNTYKNALFFNNM